MVEHGKPAQHVNQRESAPNLTRRSLLLAAASFPLVQAASAGPVDWYNGVKLGSTLPDFDAEYFGEAPSGDRKLLLIDFWATWCAPCREEFPHLNELSSRFRNRGLVVVGLTQESRAVAEAFLQRVDIQYTVGAAGAKPLQKALGIKALPYAIVVDDKNQIIWRGQASSLRAAEIEQLLERAASPLAPSS